MGTGEHADEAAHDDELRQDVELYQGLTIMLAEMPAGTRLDHALRSSIGNRIRRKWELKYGRNAPLWTT